MPGNAYLKKGISAKGNVWYQLVIEFDNGYVFRTLLTNEQAFILKSLLTVKE